MTHEVIYNENMVIPQIVIDRFEDKIFYCLSGCWLWTGGKNPGGYGFVGFKDKGKTGFILAHRLSYRMYRGKINGLHVCHHCDNPLCVNPDHLFLGTPADNTMDRMRKSRQARGKSLPISKLDPLQITVIRECRKEKIPQHKIARYFNVHQSLISYIERKKIWNYV